MTVEIIKFRENKYADDPVLAEVLVEVRKKMKLWFRIIKGKSGKVFCVPPSFKCSVDQKWESAFELSDLKSHRRFCQDILQVLIDTGRIEA